MRLTPENFIDKRIIIYTYTGRHKSVWCKDGTKFVNKIKHFADVSDQPVQQQKQRQQLEVNPENIVSTSINVFPPGKPPPVSSDSKQLYKSKQQQQLRIIYRYHRKINVKPKEHQKDR